MTARRSCQFRSKLRDIENWVYDNFNMEIHFFLNEISRVKNNLFDEDDDGQLSGSSIGELLKEEFLRSSIVLNGKIPFWWMVPADTDNKTYEAWLGRGRHVATWPAVHRPGQHSQHQAGGLPRAGLFQMLKSLGNPFKSIIKLGLLERYINNYMDNPFICNIIKKNVHEDKLNYDHIDAYVIMFNYVYDYLQLDRQGRRGPGGPQNVLLPEGGADALAALQDKADEGYNPRRHANHAGIHQEMELAGVQNQGDGRLQQLEHRAGEQAPEQHQEIRPTGVPRHPGQHRNAQGQAQVHRRGDQGDQPQDLLALPVADNKIDNTLSFKNYPPEKLLKIDYVRDRKGKEIWILSKRLIIDNHPNNVIIHKDNTLLGLSVWISLNGLFKKDYTRLEIDAGIHPVDPNFLRGLIAELTQHFSIKRLDLHSGYFLKESFPVMSYIIINPLTKYSKKIEEILFLFHNSWGETRFERHGGEADIPRVVTAVLNGALRTGLDFDRALRLVSSQPYSSSREFDRLTSLLRDMHGFFIDGQSGVRKRYVAPMANVFFVFSTTRAGGEEIIACTPFDSELKLLYGLSYNTGAMNRVRIAPNAPELNYLGKIIENSRGDAVQIYVQKGSKYCYFFVSDERGSVIFFRKAAEIYGDYLARLHLFALAAVREVTARNPGSPLAGSPRAVQVYKIDRGASHSVRITEFDPELDPEIKEARKRAQPFRLSLHQLASGETGYRFTLPDGSYTNVYTRANMLQVIGDLRLLMRSVRGYSFHASDIDLSQMKAGPQTASTSFAFTGKNTFELLVEKGVGSARDATKTSPSR